MYKKILVAIDLTENSGQVIQRAREIADKFKAEIRLLHVVEYVPIEPMGEALMPAMDIERDLVANAERNLEKIAVGNELALSERSVETGSIKGEIVRVADENSCDLIVLGSRERHGLAILINTTEDTVLHSAKCDVLAVRLS
ncbi:MAG: universal stress protein [Gammaproteobacteria bacterium]|jgi:universal stress protein A|nr:universal stress protein [Gammaproteobacteria bacterium]